MMKDYAKMAIIGIAVIIFAFFVYPQTTTEEIGADEFEKASPNVPEPEFVYAAFCDYPFYEIEYVDSINSDRCYAIRNVTNGYEASMLRASIKNNESKSEYFDRNYAQGKKMICHRTDSPGKSWCLRDNSTCLLLEDNDKICNIVSLGG